VITLFQAAPAIDEHEYAHGRQTASPASGHGSASDDVKSYDLLWLIHLVGDTHQPLHAIPASPSLTQATMAATRI
jgi:hypothetical protein